MLLSTIIPLTIPLLPLPLAQSTATNTSIPISLSGNDSLPTPTASPLPPVNPIAQTFLSELSTAFFYAVLIANGDTTGRDADTTCEAINPDELAKVGQNGFNGTAVQREVCTAAQIESGNPALGAELVRLNQDGVGYLATAIYAVQLVGGYAGGTDLRKLCEEIEAVLVDNLFINYTDTKVGTSSPRTNSTSTITPTAFEESY